MKIFLISLAVVLFAVLPVCADDYKSFDKPVDAEVISAKAFIRADHDNSAKRVLTLEEGDFVSLVGFWDGGDAYPWYYVMINTDDGWIYGQNVQRLDGAPDVPAQKAAPAGGGAGGEKPLPAAGVTASDADYVTVIAHGQGTDRAKAQEQAWIEAVRLAVGAVISSTSELNNDDFAENTIAHSRGVIETFDIVGENDDGRRVTVAIQAKVHREILTDAAITYSEAQTMKADTGGAVKVQMDMKAQDSTADNKQKSGAALLQEVLEAYTPDMFYSAALNPKIEINKENKKPFIKITQKFNQELFWKEFIPRLHEALEGVAVKKEKMFYNDAVRQANQKLAKEGYAEWLGTYGESIQLNVAEYSNAHQAQMLDKNNNPVEPNPIAPYSWYSKEDDDYYRGRPRYPTNKFLMEGDSPYKAPLTVVIPENASSFIVYYLPCDVNFDFLSGGTFKPHEHPINVSDEELYSLFINYMNKMSTSLVFSITYIDLNGDEIHTQIIQTGHRMLTIYRSFYFNIDQTSVGRPVEYWTIPHIFSFSPGYVGGDKQDLFLGSGNYDIKYNAGWYIELDESDLQKLDSMKFEYIFVNQ